MIALMSPSKAQRLIAENIREHRLQRNLTQQELSSRSGVPLSTLRKFEQQGVLSLESLLKILMVLGMLDTVVNATKIEEIPFTSIDEIIALNAAPKRKRARSK
ncbi:helix-turn-helix domain protein [Sphaerochaeta globosa str. Buddy]|uniref:Helix-turn-helix domain protein n=2 Tax=Sphaerochaeta TaxID=399320 RepID=F0RU65_SPHGB|nr:helix-turn-helix domain protein [Sphaerochaeta globosa str. Buddy]